MPGAELKADLWVNEYLTPYDVYQHGITRVLAQARTEYQDMSIVETGVYGKALVLDGKWQSCTGDEFLYHEPLVHAPCAMHGSPAHILVLGGGEGATVREALKWNSVRRVSMVDLDGQVVDACKQHLPEMHQGAFDDPRTDLVVANAFDYIKDPATTPEGGWDVIVSDLSDPIEEGPSFPLFTKEYFADLAKILSPRGVLVVQSGCVAPPEMHLHARLASTLRSVYAHTASYSSCIPTYPSPWSFILASAAPLDLPGPERIDALLAEHAVTPLRMFDGTSMQGLFHLPKHLREAIARETEVYTQSAPPTFFGKGTLMTDPDAAHP